MIFIFNVVYLVHQFSFALSAKSLQISKFLLEFTTIGIELFLKIIQNRQERANVEVFNFTSNALHVK
jgi:hypothetical protein